MPSLPERFWGEFENLFRRDFVGHTRQVYATDDDTMVVVWRGPLPVSVQGRFQPYIERGDLELVRQESHVLDHLIRHLQHHLGDTHRLVAVDLDRSIAATADFGRLFLVAESVPDDVDTVLRLVEEKARDYRIGIEVQFPRALGA